jgi:hypothetical protein
MAASGAGDFDFQSGAWNVHHRRLKARLAQSDDWEEFTGTCIAQPVLGGNGNMDDNLLNFPGGPYRAVTLRSFDPETGNWAIWWLDARRPHQLDVPVIGRFTNGRGEFLARDTFEGEPIVVRFLWLDTDKAEPRWEQAFSPDEGKTWETNWTMRFVRMG